jgi:hypothetical protein
MIMQETWHIQQPPRDLREYRHRTVVTSVGTGNPVNPSTLAEQILKSIHQPTEIIFSL